MFDRDSWQEIFDTIRKNKLRTFLSGFTIALGILIFTILFGMGNGLKNRFVELFIQDDAINTLFIYPGITTKPHKGFAAGRTIKFHNDDLTDLRKDFALFYEYLTPRINDNGITRYKSESNTYPLRAVSPAHQFNEQTIMMKGRYLNERDLREKGKVAVIGRLVEKDLFKGDDSSDALGKFIEINGLAYKIVGVYQDDGGDNEERMIYIPYTTKQLLDGGTDELDQIIFGYHIGIGASGAIMLEKKIDAFLKDKYQIAPDDENAIFISNRAENLDQNLTFASVIQAVVFVVGLGTLLAGVIGIATIMIFVVKERTKELGIRKALGATPKSVVSIILKEAIFITIISGYIGMVVGVGILKLIGNSLQEDYFISNPYVGMGTVIAATVILVLSGSLAGYIPARRAARIKPIIALRDE